MIFNIFKSKPTLKELIPEGFVDIHSHILPGIDDGAKNISDSLKIIKKLKNIGYSKLIFTPHVYPGLYNNEIINISEAYDRVNKKMKDIDLKVEFAAEYMVDDLLEKKIQNNSIITIKNQYVLIEMGYLAASKNIYEIIFELKVRGYFPVLAHPERYLYYSKNIREIYKLKKNGCKFQMNLFSLTGFYGNNVKGFLENLLKNNFIDYVGTDIHNSRQLAEFEKKISVKHIQSIEKAIENTNLIFNK